MIYVYSELEKATIHACTVKPNRVDLVLKKLGLLIEVRSPIVKGTCLYKNHIISWSELDYTAMGLSKLIIRHINECVKEIEESNAI